LGLYDVRFMGTLIVVTDSIGKLLGCQHATRGNNGPFAMDPFWLNRIQPRAFDRQQPDDDADAGGAPFDRQVVLAQPRPDLPADVPGCIVPDQEQRGLARPLELRTPALQDRNRHGADRAPIHKLEQQLVGGGGGQGGRPQQHAVAGQRRWITIIGRPHRLA
jgi:hypothetical protein